MTHILSPLFARSNGCILSPSCDNGLLGLRSFQVSSHFNSSSSKVVRKCNPRLLKSSIHGIQLGFRYPQGVSGRSSVTVPKVVSQDVKFKSRKTVSIPCQELSISVQEYLTDTERIVETVFPDSNRIRYLGDQTWRARLKPVTFFTLSATPVCDMRAWFEGGSLNIKSDRVVLTLDGLPPQFHDIKLHLDLKGKLFVNKDKNPNVNRNPNSYNSNATNCSLDGWVDLSLALNLPPPFSFLPQGAVTGVGDSILDNILSVMQRSLLTNLVTDYYLWTKERLLLKSRQSQVKRSEYATMSKSVDMD